MQRQGMYHPRIKTWTHRWIRVGYLNKPTIPTFSLTAYFKTMICFWHCIYIMLLSPLIFVLHTNNKCKCPHSYVNGYSGFVESNYMELCHDLKKQIAACGVQGDFTHWSVWYCSVDFCCSPWCFWVTALCLWAFLEEWVILVSMAICGF